MRLFFLRDLHSVCIFIDAAIKSELLTFIFQSDFLRIWTQAITLILQSKRLNQVRLTPLATTVYLSPLSNPISSHQLFSIRLPKYMKNEGFFMIFLQEIGRRITKSIFTQCWNRKLYSYFYQNQMSVLWFFD